MKHRLLHGAAITLLALLTACSTPVVNEQTDTLPDAQNLAAMSEGERNDLASRVLQRANESSGEQREQLLLKAARLFYRNGNIKTAERLLAVMRPPPHLRGETALLAARVALAANKPKQALKKLPPLQSLPPSRRLEARMLEADIRLALGDALEAVRQRIALAPLLKDETTQMDNNEKIWAALSSLSTTRLYQARGDTPALAAWLDLARVIRRFSTQGQSNISQVEDAVLDWATRHPQHNVSNAFLAQIIDEYMATAFKVKVIAVLLPQQGKYATVADTLRNGLLSAYYADNHSETRPRLNFYDTADPDRSFAEILQQALDDGATNIIGPLDKPLIDKLLQQHDLPIPVLALNYGAHPETRVDNLYQFGLSPEDEARQAAELGFRQGHGRAAILAPDSDWGRRLQQAFSQAFEQLGGRVVAAMDYSTASADYSRPIRRLFNLDQSKIRLRRIEDTLGKKLQFEPYRRQDIDMIFIAATARAARGIIPAIRFHHGSTLPVYATSHVYTGTPDPDHDEDLNGLLFCDMPWVLEAPLTGAAENPAAEAGLNTNLQTLKQQFNAYWPGQRRYTRLFALGVDAYHLIFNLEYLHANDFARFPGATGNIHLDPHGRVIRRLLWARFKQGKAVYIEPEIKLQDIGAPTTNAAEGAAQTPPAHPPAQP